MKKFAAAIFCFMVLPGVQAQESISFYGSIDEGVDYLTNAGGGHMVGVNAGKRSPDRFGWRGTEDLGDGLAAFFRLEAGFNSDTGTATNPAVFFNRYSLVGLKDNDLGALYVGHFPDLGYEYLSPMSNAVPGLSSSFDPGSLDFPTSSLSNAVGYESPNFKGLQFGAMNGFGETPGDSKANRSYSFGARYNNGPLRLGATYSMFHNRAADIRGLFGFTNFLGQPIAAGTQFATSTFRTMGVAASYVAGIFTPHVLITDINFANNQNNSASLRNYQAGVNIDISGGKKIDLLGLSYGRYSILDVTSNQYNLLLGRYLSINTQIYAGFSYIKAGGPNATAGFSTYAKSSSNGQGLVRIGVNHLF